MAATEFFRRSISILSVVALLHACSGGGGGSGGPGDSPGEDPPNRPLTIDESLTRLGVNTTVTPRLDDEGKAMPEDYAPFGATWTLDRKDELFFAGIELAGGTDIGTLMNDFEGFNIDGNGRFNPEILYSIDDADAPWMREQRNAWEEFNTLRAFTGADVDGDGYEELVALFVEHDELILRVIEDQEAGFVSQEYFLLSDTGITDVSIIGGDWDGDGAQGLAVAYSQLDRATLMFASFNGDTWDILAPTKTYDSTLVGSFLSLRMAAGRLDLDQRDELVVVLNEQFGTDFPAAASEYATPRSLTRRLRSSEHRRP